MTFAPVVKRVAPAVVNVYTRGWSAASLAAARRSVLPPVLRRVARACRQTGPAVAGLGRDRARRRLMVTNNHVIDGCAAKSPWCWPTAANSRRSVLGSRSAHRSGRAEDRYQAASPAGAALRRFRPAGRRYGAGDRRSLRRRPDRHHGHRLGAGPHPVGASDYHSSSRPTPPSIPGNSGGALVRSEGRLAGINAAIYSRERRLDRHRLRHSRQSSGGRRPASRPGRQRRGHPWLGASGQAVTSRDRQRPRSGSPGRRSDQFRRSRQPGRTGRARRLATWWRRSTITPSSIRGAQVPHRYP